MSTTRIQISHEAAGSHRSIDLAGSFDPATLASTVAAFCDVMAPRVPPAALVAVGRIKIAADGTKLPADYAGTDHVAVLDEATGLMWPVESIGDPKDADDGISQEKCAARCQELRLLGHDDWRLPTRAELVSLIDDTRRDPAIDTNLFPRVKPRWHWTSTAAAWSSASAWLVGFDGGSVGGSHRSNDGFALAVRRAGQ